MLATETIPLVMVFLMSPFIVFTFGVIALGVGYCLILPWWMILHYITTGRVPPPPYYTRGYTWG